MMGRKLVVLLVLWAVMGTAAVCTANWYVYGHVSPDPRPIVGEYRNKGLMAFSSRRKKGSAYDMQMVINFIAIGAAAGGLLLGGPLARAAQLGANRKTKLYGSARWGTERDLRRMGLLSQSGVVFGQTDRARFVQRRAKRPRRKRGESHEDYAERLMRHSDEAIYKMKRPGAVVQHNQKLHTLVVGSTRSGKGVSNVIPTCFSWPESIIVMDPKSEAWAITSAFRSQFSYTAKFCPEDAQRSIHYNPLHFVRRGSYMIADVMNLAYILIPADDNEKDKFWSDEGRKLFATVVMYTLLCSEEKTLSSAYGFFTKEEPDQNSDSELSQTKQYLEKYFQEVMRFMQDGAMPKEHAQRLQQAKDEADRAQEHLEDCQRRQRNLKSARVARDAASKRLQQMQATLSCYLDADDLANCDRLRQDLSYFKGCEDKQLGSVVSTAASKLLVFADPLVQEVTRYSDFTMADLVDGKAPMSLYLCASSSSLARLMPLFKIFFEQTVTLLTKDLSKRRNKVLMLLDEFYQLGNMEIVNKALSLAAGYGVVFCIAIQSYGQLDLLYKNSSVFVDNFAYQVILSVNDDKTTKKIEELLGKQTLKHSATSFSGDVRNLTHKGENVSVSQVGRSLMTSDEIRSKPFDEEIVIPSAGLPYRGKKIMYYMDKRFIRLYRPRKRLLGIIPWGWGDPMPPPPLGENLPHPDAQGVGIDSQRWMSIGADMAQDQGVQQAFAYRMKDFIADMAPRGDDAKAQPPAGEIQTADNQMDLLHRLSKLNGGTVLDS